MAQHTAGRDYGRSFNAGGKPGYPNRAGSGSRENAAPTLDTSGIVFGENINPRLYSDFAEQCAQTVAAGAKNEVNRSTQLRRFYDELVMLQSKVGNSDERFRTHEPFIQMLKAKVAYAVGRKKVDANFEKLMRQIVDQATDHKRLAQAKLFLEAFMAFYKVHRPD